MSVATVGGWAEVVAVTTSPEDFHPPHCGRGRTFGSVGAAALSASVPVSQGSARVSAAPGDASETGCQLKIVLSARSATSAGSASAGASVMCTWASVPAPGVVSLSPPPTANAITISAAAAATTRAAAMTAVRVVRFISSSFRRYPASAYWWAAAWIFWAYGRVWTS